MRSFAIVTFIVLLSGASAIGSKVRFEDKIIDPSIHTVQLFPNLGRLNDQLLPAIISIDQERSLQLSFDQFSEQVQTYSVKIIHCNKDWTSSDLLEMEYLKDFMNEHVITQYHLSLNTRTHYVHYVTTIPAVKLPGNYVIKVFRNHNLKDVVLTKKFMVYAHKVMVKGNVNFSTGVLERFTHQQLDFTIDYSSYPFIFVPHEELSVVLRQNFRWDNAITNLKPLFIEPGQKKLSYNYFNLENNFSGGNEFRVFDLRRIRTSGINVGNIVIKPTSIDVFMAEEKSRHDVPYLFQFDEDGRFMVFNNEIGGNFTDPEYVHVHFDLKINEMPKSEIYLLGGFNDFVEDKKYLLKYNKDSKSYKLNLWLKQGYYNYIYGVKTGKYKMDHTLLEGSHFQTQNRYDIIVYHRPPGGRADLIIGYFVINHNSTH